MNDVKRAPSDVLCLWCGPAAVVFISIGFLVGGLIPPPSPADTAREAAAYWNHDLDTRRIGIALIVLGSTLFAPFLAIVAKQIRRIEGPGSALAYTQLLGAAATVSLAIAYAMFMMTVVFRPDRPAEITQALSDLGWLPFVGVWSPGALSAAALGIAILGDRRKLPILPRWLGWFSVWYAFTSLSGSLVIFFHTGPFAYDGLIAFYVAATAFFAWYVVVFALLKRSIEAMEYPELT